MIKIIFKKDPDDILLLINIKFFLATQPDFRLSFVFRIRSLTIPFDHSSTNRSKRKHCTKDEHSWIKNTTLSSFDASHGEKQDEFHPSDPFFFFFFFHPFLHSLPLLFLHSVSSFTVATLIKAVKGLLTVTGIPIMKIPLPRSRESFWSRRLNEPILRSSPLGTRPSPRFFFTLSPVSMSQLGRNPPLPLFSDQILSALIFITTLLSTLLSRSFISSLVTRFNVCYFFDRRFEKIEEIYSHLSWYIHFQESVLRRNTEIYFFVLNYITGYTEKKD